jgi:hypothetical protein
VRIDSAKAGANTHSAARTVDRRGRIRKSTARPHRTAANAPRDSVM